MKYISLLFIFISLGIFFLVNGCVETKKITKKGNTKDFNNLSKTQQDSVFQKEIQEEITFISNINYILREKSTQRNANWEVLDSLYKSTLIKYKNHKYLPAFRDYVFCYYIGIPDNQPFKFIDNEEEKTKVFLNYYQKEFLQSRSGQLEVALFMTNLLEKYESKKDSKIYAKTLLKTFSIPYRHFDEYLNDTLRGKKENKSIREQERFNTMQESSILLKKLQEIVFSKL